MTDAEVVGLTEDRERVLVRVGDETVEVSLIDIHRAERQRPAVGVESGAALTPRVIQHRIRSGESADQIAREAGWPYSSVARYEGPALAERVHHADAARAAEVDGQLVGSLVAAHFGVPAGEIDWDAWLTSPGRWEVRGSSAGRVVRLRWDPLSRRVSAADDASRRALKQAAAADALTAVLRPLSTSQPPAPPPAPLPAAPPASDAPRLRSADAPPEPADSTPSLAVEPTTAEPATNQPETAEPETAELETTEPAATETATSEPAANQPAATESAPTQPPVRQPRRPRAEVPLWSDISLSVGGRLPDPPS
ncbi:MAG: hypothetical protein NVSMB55_23960 [Mycobacteriales bacterium]